MIVEVMGIDKFQRERKIDQVTLNLGEWTFKRQQKENSKEIEKLAQERWE